MSASQNGAATTQEDAVVSQTPAKSASRKRAATPKAEEKERPDAEPAVAPASGDQMERALERADVLLDQVGQRVGAFAVTASQRFRRWAALAREEGEDVWAEAQSLRDRLMARRDRHS